MLISTLSIDNATQEVCNESIVDFFVSEKGIQKNMPDQKFKLELNIVGIKGKIDLENIRSPRHDGQIASLSGNHIHPLFYPSGLRTPGIKFDKVTVSGKNKRYIQSICRQCEKAGVEFVLRDENESRN